VEATLKALSNGQVRTLLVDPTAAEGGFRCTVTGRLTIKEDDCENEGDAGSLPDVIDEAIEEVLRQGGQVDVMEGEEARSEVHGLAALLRFRGD
jgi:peptide subunit release factor 1 (eRF1)